MELTIELPDTLIADLTESGQDAKHFATAAVTAVAHQFLDDARISSQWWASLTEEARAEHLKDVEISLAQGRAGKVNFPASSSF
jgi:hypothetical protein